MNGDHWLLYLTPPRADVLLPTSLPLSTTLPPQDPKTPLATLSTHFPPPVHHLSTHPQPLLQIPARATDQTLEILMSDLHPSVCKSFYHPNPTAYPTPGEAVPENEVDDAHSLGGELAERLGIRDLFEDGTAMDSFLFSPCGYSMNAVKGDRYATIHVTPEVDYSYASFETNFTYPTPSPSSANNQTSQTLIRKVLRVFRPAKLSITLFVSDDEEEDGGQKLKVVKDLLSEDLLELYERVDRIVYEFEGYSLVYAVFQIKER